MAHTAQKQGRRKEKKSYTLSPQSVEFLEALRKKQHASSTSSVLEEILQAFRRGQEKAAIERAVASYYSSIPTDEMEDLAKWGEFAEGEFPRDLVRTTSHGSTRKGNAARGDRFA